MTTSRIIHPSAILVICTLLKLPSYTPGDRCGSCPTWCNSKCSSIDLFMVQNECRIVGADMDCQCCCGKVAPTGASPPPSAPTFSEDTGKPHDICSAEQKSILIPREQARDYPFNPPCEAKCKEQGRSCARSECWGASRDFVAGSFTYYSQTPPWSPALERDMKGKSKTAERVLSE
ncbi:hypothetical protein MKW92_048748 [Papaver armeniacum]|nr:hypothetical protein MKW92_048748 [Papaver armeniacum]